MERSVKEGLNLEWLAKKLKDKKLDENFIRAFSEAESGVSWRTFEDVVEGGRKVSEGVRADLRVKVEGVPCEEAALRTIETKAFKTAALGARADAKFISVWREAAYGGKKSIDIVALSDKAELVFGEVKHWSTASWQIPRAEKELLEQLKRHNEGISEIAKNMNRRTSHQSPDTLREP